MKLCLFVLLLTPSLMAAVPGKISDDNIALALRQPHEVAIQTIKNTSSQGLLTLQEMAFNDKWPMKTRWKSFMLLTQIKGKKSIPQIKKALLSKTWFMRSAGLTALKNIDSRAAKKWAYHKLDQDPALLVRMKALEILKDERGEKVKELFWKKIYSSDSRHRNKSLWIREDLARILMKKPRKKDLKRWVRLLHESDEGLQVVASFALNKMNSSGAANSEDISFWQKKYPSYKTL